MYVEISENVLVSLQINSQRKKKSFQKCILQINLGKLLQILQKVFV